MRAAATGQGRCVPAAGRSHAALRCAAPCSGLQHAVVGTHAWQGAGSDGQAGSGLALQASLPYTLWCKMLQGEPARYQNLHNWIYHACAQIPREVSHVLLPPGGRADLLVCCSGAAGTQLTLRSGFGPLSATPSMCNQPTCK